MKKYGISERINGVCTLTVAAIVYLFYPREVENNLLRALQLRKLARISLHSELS